jgi:hypothetical protein
MSVIEHSNPYARWLIILGLISSVAAAVFFVVNIEALEIGLAFCFLPILIAANMLAALIYVHGPGPLPIIPFLAGALFAVGGTAIDVIATVVNDPFLTQEANPIARAFLDAGFAALFVYGFGAAAQILAALLTCLLWAAFLRHSPETIKSALATNPKSAMEFIKAAGGAEHLTWRQWIIPFKMSELPKAYHTLWFIAVMLVGADLGRWYLGLEWFALVPNVSLYLIATIGMLAALILYLLWLVRQYQIAKQ